MRGSGVWVTLAAIALPGLLLYPAWRCGGLGAGEDDILYYYPSRVLIHELVQQGRPPWLNPYSGLGRPLLADPQSALFYPLTWLLALVPAEVAYPASLWLHYSLALGGMYRLLRSLRLGCVAAFFGAVAFAFCGFLLAHRAHLTIQHSAAWAPWVFWRITRFAALGGGRRLASAALVAALQGCAGHIQIAGITALGTLVYLLSLGLTPWLTAMRRWLTAWALAGGLLAVQIIPTYEYVRICTRGDRGYMDFVENSWSPVSTVGWLTPMLLGQRTPNFFDQPYWGPSHQSEQFAYPGVLTLLLAMLALRGWRGDPQRRAWAVLLAFSLLLALGLYGPVSPILYWLPGASLFRVPARGLLLFNLSAAALAALALHDLGPRLSPARARLRSFAMDFCRRPVLKTAAMVVAISSITLVAISLVGPDLRAVALRSLSPWKPAIWVPAAITLASFVALGWIVRGWRHPHRRWLAAALVAVDLGVVGWTLDVPAGWPWMDEILDSPSRREVLAAIGDSPERLWVVTGRQPAVGSDYGVPGQYLDPLGKCVSNTNTLAHVSALTDYGPLQPRSLAALFGFKPWGETDRAAELLAQEQWVRPFNIGWLLLCEPVWSPPSNAGHVLTTAAGYRLYRQPDTAGPAFFEDAAQPGAVHFIESAPHKFATIVDTWPGALPKDQGLEHASLLIVSRLALPGWRATCDGRALPVETAHGALLAVRMDQAGPLRIEWSYFPPGLTRGATVSFATLVLLVLLCLWQPSGGLKQRPSLKIPSQPRP